ncbi:hypothetical protein U1Q18_035780 [Sarracenia purpurea var. burkii]
MHSYDSLQVEVSFEWSYCSRSNIVSWSNSSWFGVAIKPAFGAIAVEAIIVASKLASGVGVVRWKPWKYITKAAVFAWSSCSLWLGGLEGEQQQLVFMAYHGQCWWCSGGYHGIFGIAVVWVLGPLA